MTKTENNIITVGTTLVASIQAYPELQGQYYVFGSHSDLEAVAASIYNELTELKSQLLHRIIDNLRGELGSQQVYDLLVPKLEGEIPTELKNELFEMDFMDYLSDSADTYKKTKSFKGTDIFGYWFWSEFLSSTDVELDILPLSDFTSKFIKEAKKSLEKTVKTDERIYDSFSIFFTVDVDKVFQQAFFKYPAVGRFLLDNLEKIKAVADVSSEQLKVKETILLRSNWDIQIF